MVLKLADNTDPQSLASRLRRRRVALFERLVAHVPDPVRVLDLGGSAEIWRQYRGRRSFRVTLLNLEHHSDDDGFEQVVGDARDSTVLRRPQLRRVLF